MTVGSAPRTKSKTSPRCHEFSVERIRELLDFCPERGIFYWKNPVSTKIAPGSIAGGPTSNGYWSVHVLGRPILAHRLAWFYLYGEWPGEDIDHINRNTLDNRPENLRLATRSENNMNRCVSATHGFKGVSLHKPSGLWFARTKVNGKQLCLGYFKTPEEAADAYDNFVEKLHGDRALTNAKLRSANEAA